MGYVEPLFGILALYDFSKKKRVSENFYFQVNPPELQDLLSDHYVESFSIASDVSRLTLAFPQQKSSTDLLTNTSKALFHISKPSADIHLVLRIEKVLQGDNDTVSEPYVKPTQQKDKDKERIKNTIQQLCPRIGNFKQPLGWGFIPLFDDSAKSKESIKTSRLALYSTVEATSISPIYRYKGSDFSDTAILEQVNETRSSSSRKAKVMPGSCIISMEDVTEKTVSGSDPSLIAPLVNSSNVQSPFFFQTLRPFFPSTSKAFSFN